MFSKIDTLTCTDKLENIVFVEKLLFGKLIDAFGASLTLGLEARPSFGNVLLLLTFVRFSAERKQKKEVYVRDNNVITSTF